MTDGFWYMATPYSKHPRGIEVAYQEACAAAVVCIRAGINTFSPIAHTHAIAKVGEFAGHFEQWAEFARAMIRASEGVIVVFLDGWEQSTGIAAEVEFCRSLGKTVAYMPQNGPAPNLSTDRRASPGTASNTDKPSNPADITSLGEAAE